MSEQLPVAKPRPLLGGDDARLKAALGAVVKDEKLAERNGEKRK